MISVSAPGFEPWTARFKLITNLPFFPWYPTNDYDKCPPWRSIRQDKPMVAWYWLPWGEDILRKGAYSLRWAWNLLCIHLIPNTKSLDYKAVSVVTTHAVDKCNLASGCFQSFKARLASEINKPIACIENGGYVKMWCTWTNSVANLV